MANAHPPGAGQQQGPANAPAPIGATDPGRAEKVLAGGVVAGKAGQLVILNGDETGYRLEAADGVSHPIAAASYLAFGDEYKLEGAIGARGEEASSAVKARAEIFADVVGRIEHGRVR